MDKKFVVYKSSAGSGKTFTLVKEYLKICLGSSNPMKFREILAITFTNKAAAEMKSRIISALQDLASDNPRQAVLKQILLQEIKIEEEQISKRAENILSSILHNYADFAVSTIDQFTFRLIRSFARELQIPLNFEVEMDKDNLLNKVIALLIDKVGHDDMLTKLLLRFTQSRMEEEKYYDVQHEIKNFSAKLLNEGAAPHLHSLRKMEVSDFMELFSVYQEQNKTYEAKLSAFAEQALEVIDRNNIEYTSFPHGSFPKFLDRVQSNEVKGYAEIEKWMQNCIKKPLYKNSAAADQKQAIDSVAAEFTSILTQMHDLYSKEQPLFSSRKAALGTLYPLALLNEVEKLLEQIKKEENIIHISDFNKKIFAVVDTEPVPFIYERIGEKYRHFMVDEFQDTSVLQYQNMLPLFENSLAEENFNMLVGDGKQAIYRWRGGEVEQFSEMPEYRHDSLKDHPLYLERQQSVTLHFNEQNLNTNFRSAKTVVDFNNAFFANLTEGMPEKIQHLYKNHSQLVKNRDKEGYVFAKFISKSGYQMGTLGQVLEIIEECLEDGFSYKDIAILCRTKNNGSAIADFLTSEGIDVISSESLLLSKSPEVKFLVNSLRYIVNKKDSVAKSFMIEFLCSLHSQDLHETYVDCAKGDEFFRRFLSKYSNSFSFDGLDHLPLYELCERLIRYFRLNEVYDVYVQSFMEHVHQFQTASNAGISSFLDWWNEKKDDLYIDAPDNVDAVQIMTIHKSKGLEFPIVIFPFADSEYTRRATDIWVNVEGRLEPAPSSLIMTSNTRASVFDTEVAEEQDKIMMDAVNILYVALTRAVDRIYILSKALPEKLENLHSFPKLINRGLKGFNAYDAKAGIFEMGERVLKTNTKREEKEEYLPEYISSNWREKLSISLEAPADWTGSEVMDAMQYGNMMHKILSEIEVKEDIEKVIVDFINKGFLSKEEGSLMKNELSGLLHQVEIGKFFQPGLQVKIEKGILTPEGKTYRPDRVVYFTDEITVVDFKSGLEEPWHHEQIRNYANLVRSIEKRDVSAKLIYLNSRKVVEVA